MISGGIELKWIYLNSLYVRMILDDDPLKFFHDIGWFHGIQVNSFNVPGLFLYPWVKVSTKLKY